MAVAWNEGPEMFLAALAGGAEGEVLGEPLYSLRLTPGHEDELPEMNVGDGLGKLKTQLMVGEARIGKTGSAFQRTHGIIPADCLMDKRLGSGNGIGIVVEKCNTAAKIREFFVEVVDFKTAVAGGVEVTASVVVGLGDAVDTGGAADGGQALFESEDDAELAGIIEDVVDHELVTLLENMQLERGAGK